MRDLSNNLLGSFPFKRRALGGGGFCFAPKFADDGTMVVRTDTDQGCFRAPGDTVWTEMLRFGDNLNYNDGGGVAEPKLDYGYDAGGTLDTAVNHGNSQYMATYFGGFLWLTANRFTTVTKANIAESVLGGNGINSPASRIEYDSGTGVVIFCDPLVGARYTTDGGANFTTSPSVPLGSDMYIAIDRSSSVVSGKHQIVYVASLTNGIYRSTTGVSGTFSLIASSPTAVYDIKVGPTGVLWVVLTDATAKKWTAGGGWVTITGSGDGPGSYTAIPDLDDEDRCVFISQGGSIQATTDGLAIDRYGPADETATVRTATDDVPWLAWTNQNYMANGGGAQDPTDHTRLVIAQGIGVSEAFDVLPDVGLNGPQTWNSITAGIDQLCVMEHKVTPNDDLIVSVLDRAFFSLDVNRPDLYPRDHGPTAGATTNGIRHSQSIDWAGDDPNFLVGALGGIGESYPYVWYSTNKGRRGSWVGVATLPDDYAGATVAAGDIAASTTQNFVWFPTQNKGCFATLDGGDSWVTCLFAGAACRSPTLNAVNHQRQILVADKDNPGHFYTYLPGNGSGDADDLASKGVWKSTDGGVNWTRIYANRITTFGRDFWHGKFRIYSRGLGVAPDLFWAVGDETNAGEDSISSNALWFSRGGASWAVVTGWDEIHDIAFGKPVLDHDYPCLYGNGWYNGVLGFYWCPAFDPTDRSGTWTMPGARLPMGSTDIGWTVSASLNTHAVTIGHGGSGLIAGGHQWSIKAKAA